MREAYDTYTILIHIHSKMKFFFFIVAVAHLVQANYILFNGGVTLANVTLSSAYANCNSAVVSAGWPGVPTSSVFPYLYGATQFSTWNDAYNMTLVDGTPVYRASDFRLQNFDSVLYPFSCGDCGTYACWGSSLISGFGFGTFWSGFGVNFTSIGNACSNWTSTVPYTNSSSPNTTSLSYACSWSTVNPQSCSNSSLYLLCLYDGPTLAPTYTPTSQAPSFSPSHVPSQAPTRSPYAANPSPLTLDLPKGTFENINFTFGRKGDPVNFVEYSLRAGLSVGFDNTEGVYSYLANCSDLTPLVPDVAYPITNLTSSWFSDVACIGYTNLTDYFSFGPDTYYYYLTWTGAQSPTTDLNINVQFPLMLSTSISVGTESVLLPVNFTLNDTLGTQDTSSAYLIFNTTPVYGTFNYSNASYVELGTPNLFNQSYSYLPGLYYFNMIANGFSNFYGEGINGCPITVSPGCPDYLTYQIGFQNQTTNVIDYYLFLVNNVLTPILTVFYPDSPLTALSPGGYNFDGSFSFVDLDDDAYMVGFKGYASLLNIGFRVNESEITEAVSSGQFVKYDCDTLTVGCESVKFYGRPRFLNYLFSTMFITPLGTSAVTSFSLSLYKPPPNGVTFANAIQVFANGVPDFVKTYRVQIVRVGTKSPTVNFNSDSANFFLNGLQIALYVIYAIGGLIFLCALGGLIYVCRSAYTYCSCCYRCCSCLFGRCCSCLCGRCFARCRGYQKVNTKVRPGETKGLRDTIRHEIVEVLGNPPKKGVRRWM